MGKNAAFAPNGFCLYFQHILYIFLCPVWKTRHIAESTLDIELVTNVCDAEKKGKKKRMDIVQKP